MLPAQQRMSWQLLEALQLAVSASTALPYRRACCAAARPLWGLSLCPEAIWRRGACGLQHHPLCAAGARRGGGARRQRRIALSAMPRDQSPAALQAAHHQGHPSLDAPRVSRHGTVARACAHFPCLRLPYSACALGGTGWAIASAATLTNAAHLPRPHSSASAGRPLLSWRWKTSAGPFWSGAEWSSRSPAKRCAPCAACSQGCEGLKLASVFFISFSFSFNFIPCCVLCSVLSLGDDLYCLMAWSPFA